VLVPLDRIGAHKGDVTLLQSLPLECSACGERLIAMERRVPLAWGWPRTTAATRWLSRCAS
jgi:hypothetical protein